MKTCLVNHLVDGVFVLSVQTFVERIAHIEKQFADHGIQFHFIFNHDPQYIQTPSLNNMFANSDLSIEHKSLILKHIEAWKRATQNNHKIILVFEDDVILSSRFCDALAEVIEELQTYRGYLVFLGGSDTKVSSSFYHHPGVLVPQNIATAEGYITDIEAIKKRLLWLEKNKISLPADHMIKDIDNSVGIDQYWVKDAIVQQGSVLGWFDTKLDGNRKKHSLFYNRLRYEWNRFQRRTLRKYISNFLM